ncbi:MAG: DUF3866 family protein [Ornithinimicrobium sp.]|uniref:DUF3866 family protein n=1 Tax=Ornithinimicrobium sp. TaxID=1977084 RepID=UPI0026DEFA28|nr:DUF3866 family protein [Ornithinimicrobium sp.]MDO5738575.1 DUF3866 family protein [Ornithinimicrobium sp.]
MIQWREGVVSARRPGWDGVVELDVEVADLGQVRALAYPGVVGTPVPGDRVLLNTTALERALGTGGYALVVAIPDRPQAWPRVELGAPGHLVKARYAPLQTMVLGVDDPEGEHYAELADADNLFGLPVVAADLHSALPAIVVGVQDTWPAARIAYVMTDGGALPAAFSRTCAQLRASGSLTCVITAGQSYGGDLEAVTVHSALLAAQHVVGADLVVVSQGPGNLGTGTRWGFSGVSAGEALNAAAVLGGVPIASLRVSEADQRRRHRGLSHHSVTAYGRVLAHGAQIPVPIGQTGNESTDDCLVAVATQVNALIGSAHHLQRVDVEVDGLLEALSSSAVRLTTMGRSLDQDAASFVAAAAAGRHAARLAGQARRDDRTGV